MTTATAMTMSERLRDFASLAKPRITFLSVFTALGGMWLAPVKNSYWAMAMTALGTALVVAAANALNCYIERDSDRQMARTRNRPLPARRMAPKAALIFGTVLALVSVPILTFTVNPVTGLLAAVALVSYVWIYTPMKQESHWALWVGAIPGAMPPLIGWTAATGQVEWPGVVLFGIMFIWQLPHFIAICMYRDQEYQRAGIQTVASVHGWNGAVRQIFFWTAVLVPTAFTRLWSQWLCLLGCATVLVSVYARAFKGFKADNRNRWAEGSSSTPGLFDASLRRHCRRRVLQHDLRVNAVPSLYPNESPSH